MQGCVTLPLARARFTQPNPHIYVLPLSGSERVEWQGTAWVQHCSIAGAQRRAMMSDDGEDAYYYHPEIYSRSFYAALFSFWCITILKSYQVL